MMTDRLADHLCTDAHYSDMSWRCKRNMLFYGELLARSQS